MARRRRQRLSESPCAAGANLSDADWAAVVMLVSEFPAAGLSLGPTLRLLAERDDDQTPDADQRTTTSVVR